MKIYLLGLVYGLILCWGGWASEQAVLHQVAHMRVGYTISEKGLVHVTPRSYQRLQRDVLEKAKRSLSPANYKKFKSTLFLLPAPAGFSGAVKEAHEKGITGAGEKAIIAELNADDSIAPARRPDIKGYPVLDLRHVGGQHVQAVSSIFQQIAPSSQVLLWNNEKSKKEKDPVLPLEFNDAVVVNFSQGLRSSTRSSFQQDLALLRQVVLKTGKEKILVKSAGNASTDLSKIEFIEGKVTDNAAGLYARHAPLQQNYIIVGNVDKDNLLTLSTPGQPSLTQSNFPGVSALIQDTFICTLGTDVMYLYQEAGASATSVVKVSGTSFAAPIVSGAIVLLAQAHPGLNAKEIREALLESANRDFFITAKGVPWYLYESTEHTAEEVLLWKKGKMNVRPFLPEIYGKGILSLRNAFIYARLKTEHKDWDKKQLRQEMLRLLKEEDNAAATTIQRKWRAHRAARAQ